MSLANASVLRKSLRIFQIYGANTDVGKTICSTVLCQGLNHYRPKDSIWYLKPVSTGPLNEADTGHINRFVGSVRTKCLYQFDQAVSPHIASQSAHVQDAEIVEKITSELASYAQQGPGTVFIETAGGVHSPSPSGTSQADLYRPLRLPIILVADSRLGGLSSTISAFESLRIRGYDIDSVMCFQDDQYKNYEYLTEFFRKQDVPMLVVPKPPNMKDNSIADGQALAEFYNKASILEVVQEQLERSVRAHNSRISRLKDMAGKAHAHIWYPFTQHANLDISNINTIDSAYQDSFQSFSSAALTASADPSILEAIFDGSASWWTQGLGHGNADLALSAAYAAGRYGHVMFAGGVQEPALALVELLLKHLENPRASRVFYSDNGSTGMEVAVKMALRASCERYGWNSQTQQVGILGLKGSYHGDTIGVMDCCEPCTFNEKVEWYKGRGYWFDTPLVRLVDGEWEVVQPEEWKDEIEEKSAFSSLEDIFDLQSRQSSVLAKRYEDVILKTLKRLVEVGEMKFGALIMEPVLLGSGGMSLIDPLFQSTLIRVVRANASLFSSGSTTEAPHSDNTWTGLPVIHDEVFTGTYRLGRFSSSTFLQAHPDISVHAKLLTGGLVPLCATVASESIYNAFLSSEKRDALLHGHSYTAHAVGCQVAETSLKTFLKMEENGSWNDFKSAWTSREAIGASSRKILDSPSVWSMWSQDFVRHLSRAKSVDYVIAIGTVLAITMKDQKNSGYSSTAAANLQTALLHGKSGVKVHSRVLGNVLYLMTSQITSKGAVLELEDLITSSIPT